MATGALDILWAMLCCSRICHGVSACLLLLKTGMLLDYYDSKRCFESPYAPGNGAQRLGSIRRNRNWLLTLLLGSHFFSQLRLSPKQFKHVFSMYFGCFYIIISSRVFRLLPPHLPCILLLLQMLKVVIAVFTIWRRFISDNIFAL